MRHPILSSNRQWGRGIAAALLLLSVLPSPSSAQPAAGFGLRERSQAASELVLQAVQQLLQSLPPPVSQSYRFEYSDQLGVMMREERVGANLFREPGTLGAGRFAARVSTAYFEAADSFVATYRNVSDPEGCPGSDGSCYTVIGLAPSARVVALNFGLGYGLADLAELYLNVPVVITNASADVSYTNELNQPTQSLSYVDVGRESADAVARGGTVDLPDGAGGVSTIGLRKRNLNDFAVRASADAAFSDGTNIGLGQIALGAKLRLPTIAERLDLALNAELWMPSPSQDEFAGVDSAGFAVRLLSAVRVADELRLLTAAGYLYDGEFASLRGLNWSTGLAYSQRWGTIDAGLGGSLYQEGIRWTPEGIESFDDVEQGTSRQEYELAAGQSNELDRNFIDLRIGAKFPIGSAVALSAGAIIPIVGDDFRPDAIGSLGLEVYF